MRNQTLIQKLIESNLTNNRGFERVKEVDFVLDKFKIGKTPQSYLWVVESLDFLSKFKVHRSPVQSLLSIYNPKIKDYLSN